MNAATRLWIGFLALITVCLTLIAGVGIAYLYRTQVQPTLDTNIAVQRKHKTLYLEDLEFVSRFDLLRGARNGEKDAGPALNAKLYWTPAVELKNKDIAPAKTASAPVVSSEVRERLLRYRNDWITQYTKLPKMKVDLSFFDGIQAFDHWNLEEASPIGDLIKAKQFVPPPSLPLPDAQDLLALAKLRLMKGAREKEQLAALKDVRQLARLLLTTEYMQHTLAALAVLDFERRAYRFYVDEQQFPAELWTPIDRNITRRAQRAMQGTLGYLHLWTPGDVFDDVFFGSHPPIGLCSAANEDFPAELALKPFIEKRFPFEQDHAPSGARLLKVWKIAEENCRLHYLHAMGEAGEFNIELPVPRMVRWVPLARQLFGMRLSGLNFTGFEAYNAIEAKPQPNMEGRK